MKKRTTKILSVILVVLMLCTAVPMTASAEETFTEGYYTYTVIDGEATITDVDTAISGDITIPSTLGGYAVTGIGAQSFYSCVQLTNIILPDSLSSIGEKAFELCTNLESIFLPNSLLSIGPYTFRYCDKLKSIILPSSITSIGEGAFSWCKNLTNISVDLNNQSFSSLNGILFNKDRSKLITYPSGKLGTTYTLPDSVTTIGCYGFQYCNNLQSIIISDSVNNIELAAFAYCENIISIEIPDSVTIISGYLFQGCSNLVYITIPSSIKKVATAAFHYCNNLIDVYYKGSKTDWDSINIDSYNDTFLSANICYNYCSHKYASEITVPATHLKEGIKTFTCFCGDSYTEAIAKLEAHTYEKDITAPSCTEKGSTTYTCECGDSYISDYIDASGHKLSVWINDYDTGIATKSCNNCDYTETALIKNYRDGEVEIEYSEQSETNFDVDKVGKEDGRYVLVEDALKNHHNGHWDIVKVFDITLKNKDGVHVQPDGYVKVKLPLDWEKDGNYKVYRVNDDGTLTDMNAYRQGSHMVFETDHFSIYVIVKENVNEEKPSTEKFSFSEFLKNIFNWFKEIIEKITDFFRSIGDLT